MKSLSNIFEGLFASDIQEGLFDVEDTISTVDRKDKIPAELQKLGLGYLREIDGIYYCNVKSRKDYELSQEIIDSIPKDIEKLSISNYRKTCYVTGDLKNSGVTFGLPDQFVVFKTSKVNNAKISGYSLDLHRQCMEQVNLVFKKKAKNISNCEFEGVGWVLMYPTTRFSNCSFIGSKGVSINFKIMYPGDYKECAQWLADVCEMPEIVDQFIWHGERSKTVWNDHAKEMLDKILKYFGVDNINASRGINIKIFNKSKLWAVIADDNVLGKHAGIGGDSFTLREKSFFNL